MGVRKQIFVPVAEWLFGMAILTVSVSVSLSRCWGSHSSVRFPILIPEVLLPRKQTS